MMLMAFAWGIALLVTLDTIMTELLILHAIASNSVTGVKKVVANSFMLMQLCYAPRGADIKQMHLKAFTLFDVQQ